MKKNKQYVHLLLETLIDFSHGRIRQSMCADSVSCCNRLKAARRSLLIVPQMAGKSLEASFFEHLHTAA